MYYDVTLNKAKHVYVSANKRNVEYKIELFIAQFSVFTFSFLTVFKNYNWLNSDMRMFIVALVAVAMAIFYSTWNIAVYKVYLFEDKVYFSYRKDFILTYEKHRLAEFWDVKNISFYKCVNRGRFFSWWSYDLLFKMHERESFSIWIPGIPEIQDVYEDIKTEWEGFIKKYPEKIPPVIIVSKKPCACCGYLTMQYCEQDIGDFCDICYWQYDIKAQEEPDYIGSNRVSINDARKNYKEFGLCKKELLDHRLGRQPFPEEIP